LGRGKKKGGRCERPPRTQTPQPDARNDPVTTIGDDPDARSRRRQRRRGRAPASVREFEAEAEVVERLVEDVRAAGDEWQRAARAYDVATEPEKLAAGVVALRTERDYWKARAAFAEYEHARSERHVDRLLKRVLPADKARWSRGKGAKKGLAAIEKKRAVSDHARTPAVLRAWREWKPSVRAVARATNLGRDTVTRILAKKGLRAP
jgi:hypothetical protein